VEPAKLSEIAQNREVFQVFLGLPLAKYGGKIRRKHSVSGKKLGQKGPLSQFCSKLSLHT